jgi:isochorismate synthase EntC
MSPEYSYYFRWDGGKEWFGASPEILLRRDGDRIMTSPLAGTMRVGAEAAADRAIRAALLDDAKEDVEHRRAVALLLDDLRPLCNGLGLDECKSLVRTPYAYHIKSEISGRIDPRLSSFDVLSRIYPPATVWGIPRSGAEAALRRVEPFERERFAGGFGTFVGVERADFALGIRTASLQRGRLSVFGGGGIVEGSVPEREWNECELKMTPFLGALDVEES